MARIKIEELPVMEDMSEKELKGILGGVTYAGLRRFTPPGGTWLPSKIGGRLGRFGRRGNIVGENNPWAKAGENNPWANTGNTLNMDVTV